MVSICDDANASSHSCVKSAVLVRNTDNNNSNSNYNYWKRHNTEHTVH